MIKTFQYFIVFFSIYCICSCKKTELITQNITQDTVITGNTPSDYDGTPTVFVENYVNKLYIDLIGEEPLDSILTQNVDYLRTNELSSKAKDSVINKIIYSIPYYNRLYDLEKSEMLEGIDSVSIATQIYIYNLQMQMFEDSGETQLAQYIQSEIYKLEDLQEAGRDFHNSSINLNTFYQRLINNSVYDEINMGSENFVKSCFENLLHRFPTTAELNAGIEMLDGNPSALFLEEGNSKGDFINIITSTSPFYEGLVIDAYQRFLLREPTSSEAFSETDSLESSEDLQFLHKIILKKEEYAGF